MLDYVTKNFWTTCLDNNIVIFGLYITRLGNKQTIKGTKFQSVFFVFFILEKNSFQSRESQQLSTNIRVLAFLFFHEKPLKPGQCTGHFIRLKRQSKTDS